MIDKKWIRYELLAEHIHEGKKQYRRVGSTREADEQKAIAELKAKAKDKRDYERNLQTFIDLGQPSQCTSSNAMWN